MTNPNPVRVSAGVPDGGRFARSGRAESAVTLDDAPATPVSRFATNGNQRQAPVPQYMEGGQPYKAELRQAMTYLRDFGQDDVVVVTGEQGQEHFAKITSDRLSGGEYGSAESRTLRASLGVNKYTYDVDAHRLATGKLGMRHASPDEQDAAAAQFAAADVDWAIARLEREDQANTRLAAANLPAVGEQAVAWEGTPSEIRGIVHDMTDRGSVAFIVKGRPGTSLVPAESVSPMQP